MPKVMKKSYNSTRKSSETFTPHPHLYDFPIHLDFCDTSGGKKAVTLHQFHQRCSNLLDLGKDRIC